MLSYVNTIGSKSKFTRSGLKKRKDCPEQKDGEWKQLNLYKEQGIFKSPCDPLLDAKIMTLLWTYLMKQDGRKKARCICNGTSREKGSVNLSKTYSEALDQSGA